jgi:hypothetical protein
MSRIKNIKRKTKLYSLEYGVGEVVGILKLYDGIEEYIEVGDSNIKIGVDINLSFIINTIAHLFGK